MFLGILAYIGLLVGFLVLVFSIATVLYYISEQLEEHTVPAKRYITRYIYAVMLAYVLLWVGDGLPLLRILLSLATNYLYLVIMKSFPSVDFFRPSFIGACIGTIMTHCAWFWHFNRRDLPSYSIYERIPNYKGESLPPFSQIASFFGLLVWTVPLLLFLSLSANDQVLPFAEDRSDKKVQRKGLAKQVVESVWQWLAETGRAFGLNIRGPSGPELPL